MDKEDIKFLISQKVKILNGLRNKGILLIKDKDEEKELKKRIKDLERMLIEYKQTWGEYADKNK